MARSATLDHHAHPAPHRDRVQLIGLLGALIIPPLVWSLHLVANYSFAVRSCYPDGAPQASPSLDKLRLVLIVIDVASLAVSLAAVAVAYRNWSATAGEVAETDSPIVETGEGRTRFLALWGILAGIGFFIAVAFDFVGLWILPICS